jgi:hypothetical protein
MGTGTNAPRGWINLNLGKDVIPCLLCRADPPSDGLSYRSYNARQVFVCNPCHDKVERCLANGDDELWHLAIARSTDAVKMYQDLRDGMSRHNGRP